MLQISLNHGYRFLFVRLVNKCLDVCVTILGEKLDERVKKQLVLSHDRNKFSKAEIIDYKIHNSRCQQSLLVEFGEDLAGLLQALFGADVKPYSGDAPCIYRGALVKPLHQAARLVGVVSPSHVIAD